MHIPQTKQHWAGLTILAFFLQFFVPNAFSAETAAIVRDFSENDTYRDEWNVADAANAEPADKFVKIDPEHNLSLKIPVRFPHNAIVSRGSRNNPLSFAFYDRFAKDGAQMVQQVKMAVYIPEEKPAHIRIQVFFFLKNKDGIWFQGLTRRQKDGLPATALTSGWNHLQIDLREDAGVLRPQGHGAVWKTYLLTQMTEMGIVVTGDREWNGWVGLDDVEAAVESAADSKTPLTLTALTSAPKAELYQCWETSFSINRALLNPFRTSEIDITAAITPPDGKEPVIVPGFYAQDFLREPGSDADGQDFRDRYTPQGEGKFHVRYAPRVPGTYRYTLRAEYCSPFSGKKETFTSPEYTFLAVQPNTAGQKAPRGYLRISRKDFRCFEFDNGEYFYSIGHNFHSPVDTRHTDMILRPMFPQLPPPKDRGLRCYEDAFPLMAANGINSFEVWMSSWWLGLEWTGQWKNYHGLGQYNQENAWKLDRLLEMAASHGLYAHLVIDNHGKASDFCDPEWPLSPYNRKNADDGGFCHSPRDLFTTAKGKDYYRDYYRYIAARWGWCPQILGVEMWSELDLVGAPGLGRSQEMREWLREMMPWFRRWDSGKHLLTTHYCGDYRNIDREMVASSCVDYVVGDAYHEPHQLLSQMLLETGDSLPQLKKPFLITEYGGSSNATNLPSLVGDLYCGMWLSWMTPAAGTPYFWWYDLLRQENYYPFYAAFSRYAAGEDRRRAPEEPQLRNGWPCSAVNGETNILDTINELQKQDHEEHQKQQQALQEEQTKQLVKFAQDNTAASKAIREAEVQCQALTTRRKELDAAVQQAEAAVKTATDALTEADKAVDAAKTPAAEQKTAAEQTTEKAPEKETAAQTEAKAKAAAAAAAAQKAAVEKLNAAKAALTENAGAIAAANTHLKTLQEKLQTAKKEQQEYSRKATEARQNSKRTQNLRIGDRHYSFYNTANFTKASQLAVNVRILHAAVLGDGKVFYAMFYDRAQMQHLPLAENERGLLEATKVDLLSIENGKYQIEVWDTYTGKVAANLTAEAKDGRLQFALPPFRTFTAVKIRR